MEPFGWVYVVTDRREPERIRYVGQTVGTVATRAQGHWDDRNRVNTRMAAWLRSRENRREDIIFTPVAWCPSREDLDTVEARLIAEYRQVGMADNNLGDGGGCNAGWKHTEESRNAMSERRRGEGHPRRKTTWTAVHEARALRKREYRPPSEIAEMLGVSVVQASKILANTSWIDPEYDPASLAPRPEARRARGLRMWNAKVTPRMAREIESRRREGATYESLAAEFGVSIGTIGSIITGRHWTTEGKGER